MKAASSIRLGEYTFTISLAIGTFLLGLFLIGTSERLVVGLGLYYVIIAIIINMLTLVYILIHAILDKANRTELIYSALLLLANIPIAGVYFYIVLETL